MKLNENELRCLEILHEITEPAGERCVPFSYIAGDPPELDIKAVRRACRSLRRKGLAEYVRGLFNEDGMVAGSGYCISTEGIKEIHERSNQGKQESLL